MQSASSAITGIFNNTTEFLEQLKSQKTLLEIAKNADSSEIANLQSAAAKNNKCIKARKCLLERYSASTMPKSLFSKEGCCPGQTAHHIIPDSYFKGPDGNIPDCDKGNPRSQYTHVGAPTVCAEGGNSSGSHGQMHTLTNSLATKKVTNGELTYKDAKDAAMEAHTKVFGGGCGKDNKCLESQLDNYFKKKCSQDEKFQVRPQKTTPGGGWLNKAQPYPGAEGER